MFHNNHDVDAVNTIQSLYRQLQVAEDTNKCCWDHLKYLNCLLQLRNTDRQRTTQKTKSLHELHLQNMKSSRTWSSTKMSYRSRNREIQTCEIMEALRWKWKNRENERHWAPIDLVSRQIISNNGFAQLGYIYDTSLWLKSANIQCGSIK